MHLQSAGWAVGPSDSLRGSCHRLKVTWCIYTLSSGTEGAEQEWRPSDRPQEVRIFLQSLMLSQHTSKKWRVNPQERNPKCVFITFITPNMIMKSFHLHNGLINVFRMLSNSYCLIVLNASSFFGETTRLRQFSTATKCSSLTFCFEQVVPSSDRTTEYNALIVELV